ncbi:hypothetical protein HRbin41_01093 [bacterium HR41]|nr:hypothetical protein HRbin41_01093 [bacterium HR41]
MRTQALPLPRPSVRAVVFAAAAAMVAAAAVALLVGDGDRRGERTTRRVSFAPAPAPPGWRALRLPGSAERGFVPARWRVRYRSGVASAEAPDRSVVFGVAALRSRGDALAAALRELRTRYRSVRPSAEAALRIAGLPAVGIEVALRNRRGAPLRALVIVARGRRERYFVQAFSRADAPASRVRELRRALATLRLR